MHQVDGRGAMPSRPGACYAKCKMPAKYAVEQRDYLRYTGDNPYQDGVELVSVAIREGSKEWVKKLSGPCLAPDQEDCMVWCLVDVPAETVTIQQVRDTMLIRDFVKDSYSYTYKIAEAGVVDWQEVLCEHYLTKQVITTLQESLVHEGYLQQYSVNGKVGSATKEALYNYQQANALPVGCLDLQTLEALRVRL